MPRSRLTQLALGALLDGIGDIPAEEVLHAPWPVEGIIHPDLTCITGQTEAGKSWLVYSLCNALLDGSDWLGRAVRFDPGLRIMCGCENPKGVQALRDLFPSEYVDGSEERADGRLVPFRLNRWDAPALRERMRSYEIGLLVIDSAFCAAGDVNDQALASDFLAAIGSLDIPVIVIHHEPKSGGRPAGAQAYSAAYRHTVRVRSAPCSTPGSQRLTLTVSGNDVPVGDPFTIGIDRSTGHAVAADPQSARGDGATAKARQRKRPAGKRAEDVGRYAASRGIAVTNKSGPKLATEILGGSRGKEDPQRLAELAAATGQSVQHQALGRLIDEERGAVEAGWRDASAVAA